MTGVEIRESASWRSDALVNELVRVRAAAGLPLAPMYWRQQGGAWFNHTLQGGVAIDPHTPVCHVSYFEADAYAR